VVPLPRLAGRSDKGSGLIDVRTLADAARGTADDSPPPTLASRLVPPHLMIAPMLHAAPSAPPRLVLWAIVGLLAVLLSLLGVLALR
jgi:hypothetical protein